jgi:hypothetical protein
VNAARNPKNSESGARPAPETITPRSSTPGDTAPQVSASGSDLTDHEREVAEFIGSIEVGPSGPIDQKAVEALARGIAPSIAHPVQPRSMTVSNPVTAQNLYVSDHIVAAILRAHGVKVAS